VAINPNSVAFALAVAGKGGARFVLIWAMIGFWSFALLTAGVVAFTAANSAPTVGTSFPAGFTKDNVPERKKGRDLLAPGENRKPVANSLPQGFTRDRVTRETRDRQIVFFTYVGWFIAYAHAVGIAALIKLR
jgi:hypothetical protein